MLAAETPVKSRCDSEELAWRETGTLFGLFRIFNTSQNNAEENSLAAACLLVCRR